MTKRKTDSPFQWANWQRSSRCRFSLLLPFISRKRFFFRGKRFKNNNYPLPWISRAQKSRSEIWGKGSSLIILSCFCFCSNGATLHLFWNSGEGRNFNCSPVQAHFPFPEFPLFTFFLKKTIPLSIARAISRKTFFCLCCGSFCVCKRRESGSPHYIRIDTWLLSARLGVLA